eukprot:517010-Pleurochrysis_carterae.AAC.2
MYGLAISVSVSRPAASRVWARGRGLALLCRSERRQGRDDRAQQRTARGGDWKHHPALIEAACAMIIATVLDTLPPEARVKALVRLDLVHCGAIRRNARKDRAHFRLFPVNLGKFARTLTCRVHCRAAAPRRAAPIVSLAALSKLSARTRSRQVQPVAHRTTTRSSCIHTATCAHTPYTLCGVSTPRPVLPDCNRGWPRHTRVKGADFISAPQDCS